ncbi:MAG TPA: siderophore-interacting protein [Nocardioides sp.]|uniref:siderophore-interacting protein n=1 Tax=Nocardioides sp. TaxID=35761 RepID=UPI002C16517E|nr:siderophore-interacting protein [Nocardioides sp.]HTW15608.1 siderophore-interacting protein [Nocardioides sp.]
MTIDQSTDRRGGGRRRPPPRVLEVRDVARLTPRLVSVTLGGEALTGFREPQPTAHIKLFLPDDNGHLPTPIVGADGMVDWPNGRPTMRTYTPRRYDAEAQTLEVQVVLHGDGAASRWAERVVPGDRVAIGGPSQGLDVASQANRWWIGGDASAIPAVGCLVDALPATASAQVHLEVEDESEHLDLDLPLGVEVVWHDRRTPAGEQPRWGSHLLEALHAETLWPDTHVWVACEAVAVRRIRTHLLADVGHPRERVTTRGYWRLGESNHSDHDHGED